MPPQRVTSACRQSTAPIRFAEVGRHVRVLARRRRPAAACSRTRRRPARSAGRDRLLEPAHVPVRRVALRPANGLLRARTRRSRRRRARRRRSPRARRRGAAGSSLGSRPSFIFTRGMPCSTQPPSCSASRSSAVRAEAAAAVDRHALVGARAAATRAARRAGARAGPTARCRRPRARTSAIPGRPTLRKRGAAVEPERAELVGRRVPRTTRVRAASLDDARGRLGARTSSRARVVAADAASTTTIVVESHSSVPSDSGCVGRDRERTTPRARRSCSPAGQELEDLLPERLAA